MKSIRRFRVLGVILTLAMIVATMLPMAISPKQAEAASPGVSIALGDAAIAHGGMICRTRQEKSFWAVGRYWLFYYGDSALGTRDFVYTSSSDNGATWDAPIDHDNADPLTSGNEADEFSVWFDGVYVHWVYVLNQNSVVGQMETDLTYRRGLPAADGSITWDAIDTLWDNPYAGAPAWGNIPPQMIYPYITVDSDNYPWVTAYSYGTADYGYAGVVYKSSTKNGHFTTAAGFPYVTPSGILDAQLIPLSGGRMVVMSYTGKADYWNGAAWSGVYTGGAVCEDFRWYDSVAMPDDTIWRVVNQETTHNILVQRFNTTLGFESPIIMATSVGAKRAPTMAINPDTGNLLVAWADGVTDKVVGVRYYGGAWDTTLVEIADESVDGIYDTDSINGKGTPNLSYNAHYNRFFIAYICGVTDAYILKGAFLDDVAGTTVTSGAFTTTGELGASTTTSHIGRSQSEVMFSAQGLYWRFYISTAGALVFRVTANNLNFGVEQNTYAVSFSSNSYWMYWNVCFDGTYFHMVGMPNGGTNQPIYYRRGKPLATGAITADAQVIAVEAVVGVSHDCVDIDVDTDGYPYISYVEDAYKVFVTKSSTKDGTWTTAGGYPVTMATGAGAGEENWAHIEQMGSGAMYAQWMDKDFLKLRGKMYTVAGGWGAVEECDNVSVINGDTPPYGHSVGSVAHTDNTLFTVWIEQTTHDLNLSVRTPAGAWSTATVEAGIGEYNFPQLSIKSDGTLWISYSIDDNIYYYTRTLAGAYSARLTLRNEAGIQPSHTTTFMRKWTSGKCALSWYADVGVNIRMMVLPEAEATTNAATSIKVASSVLNGEVGDDGDEVCSYQWQYGLSTATGWSTDFSSPATLVTGDESDYTSTGLTPFTLYYFRLVLKNTTGVFQGDWLSFTTLLLPPSPIGFTAQASSATSVSCTWITVTGATQTLVRYTVISPSPTLPTTGTVAYYGAESSAEITGLTPGTTYFFSAWGFDAPAYFSAAYGTAVVTTPCGGTPIFDEPDHPSTEPDSTRLDSSPVSGLIDFMESYAQLPRATVGLLGFISILMFFLLAVAVYSKSVLAVLVCATAGLVIGHSLGLISMVFLVLAIVGGYAIGHLRGGQPSSG